MRQPEMSHSPAYYQNDGQLVKTYLHDSEPSTIPSAHLPPGSSLPLNPKGIFDLSPSQSNPIQGTLPSRPSDTRDVSYNHHYSQQAQPNRQSHHQVLTEFISPGSEPSVVAPVMFVSSPHVEDSPILTRASHSSGAVRKEERVRTSSLTDHSSYMSGDNRPHSTPHVHKRGIHDDNPPVDHSEDALLMLFRLSLPVLIFSFCTTLYTLFGLVFVVLVFPLRLCSCIPYLRSTSFCAQLCDLLVPQLHVHERLVCLPKSITVRSSSTQSIYNDPEGSTPTNPTEFYSIGGLILVLLLSFPLSIAFLLLTWTAAFFWIFAMVLGNPEDPDGTDRKDDGRAAVLGVSRWWQLWLGNARKPPK